MTFDPQSSVTPLKNDEFTDDVQIRPQRLKLKLRAGQPEQFTLQFRPSKNFPLDVYFFLDVTGSFSRRFSDTVTPLATELVALGEHTQGESAISKDCNKGECTN
jgi:hypothetical protein